jgi:hypothetical protein
VASQAPASPAKPEHYRGNRLKGRLPDGSTFLITYNAAAEKWTGELVIGAHSFTGSSTAAMKLLAVLDNSYRAFLNGELVFGKPKETNP